MVAKIPALTKQVTNEMSPGEGSTVAKIPALTKQVTNEMSPGAGSLRVVGSSAPFSSWEAGKTAFVQ